MSSAVYLGQNKLDIIQRLIKGGADLSTLNHSGASYLMLACSNEDSDPKVVRFLLEHETRVNLRMVSQTNAWRFRRLACRCAIGLGVRKLRLLRRVAESSGLTALHYAARRGDVEIVELLMEYKANPSIKNDLGRDVLSYCESFPEIKGAIERVKREAKRVQQNNNKTSSKSTSKSGLVSRVKSRAPSQAPTMGMSSSSSSFTLQRRLSTATDIKYDMYLMSLSTMMKLFGSPTERKKNLQLCHQELLQKGMLTRFEDLPLGAFVMFISHQWNGFNHPDPNGVQIECMVKTFRRLRDGKIARVDTDPFHTILYKTNHVTYSKEWMQLLSNAYIFYDFWSQPQPTMEPENTTRRAKLEQDLQFAISSMGAYVERADCLVVLVPGATHVDKIDPKSGRHEFTCYRT